MKKGILFASAVWALVCVLGCAPGPNELTDSPDEDGDVAGFWLGLWHGFISPFTFVVSLFSDTVRIYEVHNSGWPYNLGYLFGIMMFFGGGGAAGSSRGK